jgi:hypothetical protein
MNTLRVPGLRALLTTMTIAVAGAICTTGVVHAQTHDHGAASHAKLTLNQGVKWATDAPLRAGMARIRALVAPQLDGAHAGKFSQAQYAALAGQVEGEVGKIVATCKLEPKADAMLHLVIGQIGEGTAAMLGKTAAVKPEQGLVKVATALNDYARHFDHPGFATISAAH